MQKGSAFSVEIAKWPQCSQQTSSPSRPPMRGFTSATAEYPVSLPRYCQPQRCAICGEPSVNAASDTGKAGRPLDPTPAAGRKIPRAPDEAARCVPGGAQGQPRPRRHAAGRELLAASAFEKRASLDWTGLLLQGGTLCSANFLRSCVNFSPVAVSANVQVVRRWPAPLFLLRGHRHECDRGSSA